MQCTPEDDMKKILEQLRKLVAAMSRVLAKK